MSAIQGKRIIYLYRILKDAATDDATALAFTTENERTKSRDADTTETKGRADQNSGCTGDMKSLQLQYFQVKVMR